MDLSVTGAGHITTDLLLAPVDDWLRRVSDDIRRIVHFTVQRVLYVSAGACVGCVRPGLHASLTLNCTIYTFFHRRFVVSFICS